MGSDGAGLSFQGLAVPLVSSAFAPPRWLRHGHGQTILNAVLPRRVRLAIETERLELPDGDFLELAWSRRGSERLAILSHGLEGSHEARYIRGLGAELFGRGWDVLAWNFRGCGPEPNRLPRAYHSGETGDLRAVIVYAARNYGRLALAGFSLGGNVTLKYLGEAPPHPAVVAGAAISTPLDLAASAAALDGHRGNWLYRRRFLAGLVARMEQKARQFPGQIRTEGLRRLRTFREFDNRYTAPLHGFRDADDYWTRSSSRQFLARLTVPTLLLNAADDPLLTPASFPTRLAEAHRFLYLEVPASGGHVGFLDFRSGRQPWCERRVAEFFDTHAADGMGPPGRQDGTEVPGASAESL